VRCIERGAQQRWVVGGFSPRVFTGSAKHGRHRVIAKRQDGLLVLPAGAGNIDVPMNQGVRGIRRACHTYLGASDEEPAGCGRLRKGVLSVRPEADSLSAR
jgi:hypothetical protein